MLNIETSPADLSLSKSSILYVFQAVDENSVPYSSATIPDGYEVSFQLHFEKEFNSGNFETLPLLLQKPNSNGQLEIDLQSLLDSEIQSSLSSPPIPGFNDNQPYLLETLKRFYLSYKEDYSGFSGAFTDAPIKAVLYGGQYRDGDFFADQSAGNSLLGVFPDLKQIAYDQPEWISWYNWTGEVKRVFIEIEHVSETGAIQITGFYNTPTDIQAGQVMTFPVGPATLGLDASVREYTVQVVEQSTDTRLSERIKYKVDPQYQPFARYLCWLNIFAAPMVLRCTGAQTRTLEMDRKIAAVLENANSILRYAKKQFQVDFEEYFVFRTGQLNLDELKALDDLLIHNQVYWITPEGFTPLIIKNKSFSYTENDFLYTLTFQAELAASQSFASGIAAINWDLSNIGGAGGSPVNIQVEGFDQLFPDQQSEFLFWTRNNGELPTNTRAFVWVLEDGIELTEGPDYTITPLSGPGQSTITIINHIPGANYKVRAQFFNAI